MNNKLLLVIEIPLYPQRIKLSNGTVKGKPYTKADLRRLPKTYTKERGYYFNGLGILKDKEGNTVYKNSKTVGKGNYETLSGNKLSSGYGDPHMRARIVKALKDFYRPFVRALSPISLEEFPIRLEWDLYATVSPCNFDLSNFWFYYKYFEDVLFEKEDPRYKDLPERHRRYWTPIIPDDSIRYVTQPGNNPRLFPIENSDDRKFIFRIYTDHREELMNHPIWKKK